MSEQQASNPNETEWHYFVHRNGKSGAVDNDPEGIARYRAMPDWIEVDEIEYNRILDAAVRDIRGQGYEVE